jgi:hypothetical protein
MSRTARLVLAAAAAAAVLAPVGAAASTQPAVAPPSAAHYCAPPGFLAYRMNMFDRRPGRAHCPAAVRDIYGRQGRRGAAVRGPPSVGV